MYGELPKVNIGKFSISQFSDEKGDGGIQVEEGEDNAFSIIRDAAGFQAGSNSIQELEQIIQTWFNKYF